MQAAGVQIAVPVFGYKNHAGIDQRHGLIRRWTVTSAAAHDSRPFEGLLDPNNTASKVWAEPRKAPTARSVVGKRRRGTPPIAPPGTRLPWPGADAYRTPEQAERHMA